MHTKPLVLLKYDKRSDGARGRAVVADVPMLRLRAGDRLEPSDELRDIGEWDDWAPAPAGSRVLFFGADPKSRWPATGVQSSARRQDSRPPVI